MTYTTSTALKGADAVAFAAKHGLALVNGLVHVPDSLIDEAARLEGLTRWHQGEVVNPNAPMFGGTDAPENYRHPVRR